MEKSLRSEMQKGSLIVFSFLLAALLLAGMSPVVFAESGGEGSEPQGEEGAVVSGGEPDGTGEDVGSPGEEALPEAGDPAPGDAAPPVGEEAGGEEAFPGRETISVAQLTLTPTSQTMQVNSSFTLTPDITPADATDKTLLWASDNSAVAEVADGVVTALEAGTTIITAITADGAHSAECTVHVCNRVAGVQLSASDKTIREGSSFTLEATLNPQNLLDNSVVWASDNNKVARVNKRGVVSGIGSGVAIVTIKTNDNNLIASCRVTVKPPVNKVALNKEKMTLKKGKSYNLKVKVTPAGAYNTAVRWKSSNKTVAKVSPGGKVTARKAGRAKIICTSKDSSAKKAACTVTVKPGVKKVRLNKTSVTLRKGKRITLKAKVYPANAFSKKVKWTSSNKSVAKVSQKGVVTAKKRGKATIRVKTRDNGKKATCKVTVHTYRCMETAFGVNGAGLVRELTAHQNDSFYLGTRYRSYSVGQEQSMSPNGAPYSSGPGMNCTGFVAYVLRKCGANMSLVYPYGSLNNGYAWFAALRNAGVKYYTFNSEAELLQSGRASKGDIVYSDPDRSYAGYDCHLSFFWGNTPHDNKAWQSIDTGNQISHLRPGSPNSTFYLFKLA